MWDFCSDPLPEISAREDDGCTIVLTRTTAGGHGWPDLRSETDQFSKFKCDLNVPSEVTLFDLFVHESMSYAIPTCGTSCPSWPRPPHEPSAGARQREALTASDGGGRRRIQRADQWPTLISSKRRSNASTAEKSTGLVRCRSNPASRDFRRSSSLPHPVSATRSTSFKAAVERKRCATS